jgi:hypothetical protein
MRLSGFCKCGCRIRTKWNVNKKDYNSFAPGHHGKLNPTFKGRKHTKESLLKQSEAKKGKKLTEEHKRNISIGGTGLKRSESTKRKISEALKKHQYDPERIKKLNENKFDATGRKWSEEVKRKIGQSGRGKHNHDNKNNPNWKGGVSFLPYPPEWKTGLKKKIRERDAETCQNPNCCKKSPTLTVHHIDYIKENCLEENLITLCYVCNSKANSRRDYWKDFYNKIISEKYATAI